MALFYFDYVHYGASELLSHLLDHILALIAIAAGIVAIYYERKLDKEFGEQRTEIKKIVESVFTRSIGNWPDHLGEITSLVKETQSGDELLILVDFFGYAHFSRPNLFKEYLRELQEARRRGVKLRILLYPEDALRANLDKQYQDRKDNTEAVKKLAQEYQAMYKDIIKKPRLETYDDFVTAVLYVQAHFCDLFLEAITDVPAEIASTIDAKHETIYCWLVRKGANPKNMIFAYSRFSGVGQGCGFKTSDSNLTAIFCREFDQKWSPKNKINRGSDLVPKAWKIAEEWKQKEEAKSAGSGSSAR